MADRIITYVTDTEGKKHPAEVRGCVPKKDLVVIYRDYLTTKLISESLSWKGDHWESNSGVTSDYDGGEVKTIPEISIRVPKK